MRHATLFNVDSGVALEVAVLFTRPGAQPPPQLCSSARCVTVSEAVMRKLAGLVEPASVTMAAELQHPGYVQLLPPPDSSAADGPVQRRGAPPRLRRLLALEGVRDPGNLGTLLRSAAAFGWDAAWLLPGCCDPFNDKALRASRGAALSLPLASGDLSSLRAAATAHGLALLAAQPGDDECRGSGGPSARGSGGRRDVQGACLVLGTEGAGLSPQLLAAADAHVSVPMPGGMESLNVGVAGSLLMFAMSEGLQPLLGQLAAVGQLPE